MPFLTVPVNTAHRKSFEFELLPCQISIQMRILAITPKTSA